MAVVKRECPHCKVRMIEGRRRDYGDGVSANQEAWLPGEPVSGVLKWLGGHGPAVPVTTYACPQCGLLLSYVDPAKAREAI